MKFLGLGATALSVLALTATAASARDQVQVAGSSTVLPYSTIVAELFGENTDFVTPVIESGGSSTGLRRFCEGVGPNTIDIANSSRSMRETEVAECGLACLAAVLMAHPRAACACLPRVSRWKSRRRISASIRSTPA